MTDKIFNPYEELYYEIDNEKFQMGLFFYNMNNHKSLSDTNEFQDFGDDDNEGKTNKTSSFFLTNIAYGRRWCT